jgi:hypothetical protein
LQETADAHGWRLSGLGDGALARMAGKNATSH